MSKKLTTIIYHRVLKDSNSLYPFEPNIKQFEAQIKLFSSLFKCLTITDAITLLKENRLPWNALCITFDDGYRDFYNNAFPVLEKYNVPATMYVTTDCLNGQPLWNETLHAIILNDENNVIDCSFCGLGVHKLSHHSDRIRLCLSIESSIKYLKYYDRIEIIKNLYNMYPCSVPNDIMLTKEHIVSLDNAGIEIGSHTLSHPIFTHIPDDLSYKEINESKEILESILNKPVNSFAYPNGKAETDYNQIHINLVQKAGYTSALSYLTDSSQSFDLFQIPRFSPAKHHGLKLLLRLIKNNFFQ